MLIENGRIFTGAKGVLENGYVLIRDGKIAAVGEGAAPMSDPERIDAQGRLVTPGFIDAHCHAGMWEEGLAFEGDDGNEETDPSTPQLRALDAVNPTDRAFRDALDYGVTAVLTGPGSANPVAGQICALKTYGGTTDEMLLKAPAAIKFAMGENPKTVYNGKSQTPATRMAIAAIIREQLMKARRYMQDLEKAEQDKDADPPELDMKCEALLPLLRREIKAHFHAHRADDICTALRIAQEFDLDPVIIHATEGHLIADTIARAGVPVVCGPIISTRTKPELRNLERFNAKRLLDAGVPVAVNTDAPENPLDMLATAAAVCAMEGIPHEKALEMLTCNAAKAAGLENRIGSILPGLDADLLLFSQDPIGLLVRPDMVICGGKVREKTV